MESRQSSRLTLSPLSLFAVVFISNLTRRALYHSSLTIFWVSILRENCVIDRLMRWMSVGRESEQRNLTGPSSVTKRFSFRRMFARKLNKSWVDRRPPASEKRKFHRNFLFFMNFTWTLFYQRVSFSSHFALNWGKGKENKKELQWTPRPRPNTIRRVVKLLQNYDVCFIHAGVSELRNWHLAGNRNKSGRDRNWK